MMKLKEVRWGFIGCGEVTEKKSGPAFNMIEGSKVVAVMSRDEEKVKSYAIRHNIPNWYTDAQELIGDYFRHYGHESRETGLYRKTDGRQLRGLCPH